MSVPSIPPLNLQQIAAGSDAAAKMRSLQGVQAQEETTMEAAILAASTMAQAAESLAQTEESRGLEDQEQHEERDRGRGDNRRHQQHRHHVLDFLDEDEPHDGEYIDIVC